MRVLVVLNSLGLGGIELMFRRALPYIQAEGVTLDFCCLGPADVLDPEFDGFGCRIHRIPKYANPYWSAMEIQHLLEEYQYDLVHSQFAYTSGGIALGARRAGVPVVVSFHAAEPTALYGWKHLPLLSTVRTLWLKWHRCLMERHADVFVGHSRVNMDNYYPAWESEPKRYRVIPNSVEFPETYLNKEQARLKLKIDPTVPLILHVGNFRPIKNHLGLLEIHHRVKAALGKAQLILIGDGAYREKIAKAVKRLDLEGDVVFAGQQREVHPYYSAADVFLFPATSEGFANVLVESQGAGLPLVASDIPAHRESVAPVQHRYLFSLPDYSSAAEKVLAQVEASRSGKNPWVAEASSFVRSRYSMKSFSQQLIELYRDTISIK